MTAEIVTCVVCCIIAFFMGSIPCGVLVGKIFYGVDPRDSGSHSIGATNVNRTMGTKAGIVVMVLDMLKGSIAVYIARLAAARLGYDVDSFWFDTIVYAAVAFGVAGHIFSPWLGFKGGKGISTGFGTLCAADWRIGIGLWVFFLAGVFLTRIISVGSIAAAASVFLQGLFFHWGSVPAILFSAIISFVVIYAHRENVKRLIAHKEPKFSVNKGKSKE